MRFQRFREDWKLQLLQWTEIHLSAIAIGGIIIITNDDNNNNNNNKDRYATNNECSGSMGRPIERA